MQFAACLIILCSALLATAGYPAVVHGQAASDGRNCWPARDLGVWPTNGASGRDVLLEADDYWMRVDFWAPSVGIPSGSSRVSVLFAPTTRVTLRNVVGQVWQYGPDCTRNELENKIAEEQQMNPHIAWVTLSAQQFLRLDGVDTISNQRIAGDNTLMGIDTNNIDLGSLAAKGVVFLIIAFVLFLVIQRMFQVSFKPVLLFIAIVLVLSISAVIAGATGTEPGGSQESLKSITDALGWIPRNFMCVLSLLAGASLAGLALTGKIRWPN